MGRLTSLLICRKREIFLLLLGGALVLGLAARLTTLDLPSAPLFDEPTFVGAARGYLHHAWSYQDHPPLGAFLIALGMLLHGDNPVGWRLLPLLFGLGLIGLAAWTGWTLFKSRLAAALAAFFVAVDGFYIVYSRVAFTDLFLTFFILAAFVSALKVKSGRQAVFLTGTLLGLACSVKYDALFLVPALAYLAWQHRWLKWLLLALVWSAGLYAAVMVASQFLVHAAHPLQAAWEFQKFIWNVHTAPDNGTFNSPWYSWPFMTTPIGLDGGLSASAQSVAILAVLPNPFLSLGGIMLFALFLCLLVSGSLRSAVQPGQGEPYLAVTLAFLGLWGGWACIGTPPYLYHYLPAYLFLLILCAGLLARLWRRLPLVVLAVCAGVLWTGWYYLPFWTEAPLSPAAYQHRLIFPGWELPKGS